MRLKWNPLAGNTESSSSTSNNGKKKKDKKKKDKKKKDKRKKDKKKKHKKNGKKGGKSSAELKEMAKLALQKEREDARAARTAEVAAGKAAEANRKIADSLLPKVYATKEKFEETLQEDGFDGLPESVKQAIDRLYTKVIASRRCSVVLRSATSADSCYAWRSCEMQYRDGHDLRGHPERQRLQHCGQEDHRGSGARD